MKAEDAITTTNRTSRFDLFRAAESILGRYRENVAYVERVLREQAERLPLTIQEEKVSVAGKILVDPTLRACLALDANETYRRRFIEVAAVDHVYRAHSPLHRRLIDLYYREKHSKEEMPGLLYVSESTFKRRRQEVVWAVVKELVRLGHPDFVGAN